MTVVNSRIRMQNFATKQLYTSTEFLQSSGEKQVSTAKLKNCGVDKNGIHAVGKFVPHDNLTIISICCVCGKTYLTDGINVYVLTSDGTRKQLLSTSGFQGVNARLYGDSLQGKIVFNAVHGVLFTDGTAGNTDSKLFASQMDCIAFVEKRIVGALGSTLYVSDCNATTLTPTLDGANSAVTFNLGSQITALCGVNNSLFIFADGDVYRLDITNNFAQYKFEKIASKVGNVRQAIYFNNKMYCFCDDGLRTIENDFKKFEVVGKQHFSVRCRPVVWNNKLIFADENDVVMYGSDGSVDTVEQQVDELAVVDGELYAVCNKKLYKYDENKFADDNFWESAMFVFDGVANKNLRSVTLLGKGNVKLSVSADGEACSVVNASLAQGKAMRFPCFGTGKSFTTKLTLSEGASVKSITFGAVNG